MNGRSAPARHGNLLRELGQHAGARCRHCGAPLGTVLFVRRADGYCCESCRLTQMRTVCAAERPGDLSARFVKVLVAAMPGMGPAAELVWRHEERFDGQGYPRGLAGERIPFAVDAFLAEETVLRKMVDLKCTKFKTPAS